MEFGNYIKKQRNNLGFTQSEIAEKLHVTRQTISNWEQGKSYPDLDTLVEISDIYKISIDALLKGDKDLKKYLDQGKAYNAFSVFKGLFFIMEGLFFLLTNYLVDYNSLIVNFCTFSFLITFAIAILYGEHVKPFFLGISKQTYRQKGYKYFNLNAVSGAFEDTANDYEGLNEMKLGYGAVITEYIGEFDIILNGLTYNLYRSFNKEKDEKQPKKQPKKKEEE